MIDINNQDMLINQKQIDMVNSKDKSLTRNINIMEYNIDNLKNNRKYKNIIYSYYIIIINIFNI